MIGTYGDNCIDRYLSPRRMDLVGGNAVNVAVHLTSLGAKAIYVGAVGNDPEGQKIRRALADRGVDRTHVVPREGRTGLTVIDLHGGERSFPEEDVGVQCPLTLSPQARQALVGCEWVHVTAFTSWNIRWSAACPDLVEELQWLDAQGVKLSLDFSALDQPDLARLVGRSLELAFASRPAGGVEETGKMCQFLQECGVREVVVTMGAGGSLWSDGRRTVSVPAPSLRPLDTLGAGDAFVAAWLEARGRGEDVPRCMERATARAAEVCRHFGAWPQMQLAMESDEAGVEP
jgi:fructoselysine 6-kinase